MDALRLKWHKTKVINKSWEYVGSKTSICDHKELYVNYYPFKMKRIS